MNEQVNLCLHPFPHKDLTAQWSRGGENDGHRKERLALKSLPGRFGPLGVPWLWVVVWTQLDLIMKLSKGTFASGGEGLWVTVRWWITLPSKQRKLVTSFRICVKIVSDCLLGLGIHPEFLSKLFLWTLRLTSLHHSCGYICWNESDRFIPLAEGMVWSLLLWKWIYYFCGSFLIFRLYGNLCNTPVNFSPKRGKDENRIVGMESQRSVIVRNIWQISLLQVSASHSCLFVSFVVKCAKLSTFLSLLTLPRQNSLSKRKTVCVFFFKECVPNIFSYHWWTNMAQVEFDDFMAHYPPPPSPGPVTFVPFPIPLIFTEFCGLIG